MFEDEPHDAIRAAARSYEQALPPGQRKQLGQYFTGIPLGKLLAHLALDPETRNVLDPMAGHGDLLDATWEAAVERGIAVQRLDGIEIDGATAEICRERLAQMAGTGSAPARQIIAADAFDPASIDALPQHAYDLVITNPPYVRYQSCNGNDGGGNVIRAGLNAIIAGHLSGAAAKVWGALADGYSGLADLSVPALILAAAIVRPSGRLALVVPATWRSRDYADVIRYLLLRCFSLECIVEDQQPGWFSDALVRTHLIVARRLTEADIAKPFNVRKTVPEPLWVQVTPEADATASAISAECVGAHPTEEFATWLYAGCPGTRRGIKARPFDLRSEYTRLEQRIHRRHWYHRLDRETASRTIFAYGRSTGNPALPEALSDILPEGILPNTRLNLEDAGITVGQGLRSGCNSFFYVTACDTVGSGETVVEAAPLFGARRFVVPTGALRPVFRRQAELASVEAARIPEGRVLNLRSWVLPEDWETVLAAQATYAKNGEILPQLMPEDLAAYVRMAAHTPVGSGEASKFIPTLSAVRTNVRQSRGGFVPPRFWYMLPDFTPRHLPAAFVPRINHGLPWVEVNLDPPVLVDANFSTFWAPEKGWTRHALKALLNSIWCRAAMEALGTPLGGGALKLEATHLRCIPVPALSDSEKAELDAVGKQLTRDDPTAQTRVDKIVLEAFLAGMAKAPSLTGLAEAIEKRALSLLAGRRRAES